MRRFSHRPSVFFIQHISLNPRKFLPCCEHNLEYEMVNSTRTSCGVATDDRQTRHEYVTIPTCPLRPAFYSLLHETVFEYSSSWFFAGGIWITMLLLRCPTLLPPGPLLSNKYSSFMLRMKYYSVKRNSRALTPLHTSSVVIKVIRYYKPNLLDTHTCIYIYIYILMWLWLVWS
jgi:hypothetical protein